MVKPTSRAVDGACPFHPPRSNPAGNTASGTFCFETNSRDHAEFFRCLKRGGRPSSSTWHVPDFQGLLSSSA